MKAKVLIPTKIAQEGIDIILSEGYEIKTGSGVSEDELIKDVKDCQAILVRSADITKNVLKAGKGLKVVAKHGAGVDNIDINTATELGIQVVNAPESNINSVAEHTVGLILAVAKNFLPCYKEMITGNFEIRDQIIGVDLEGKTLGLVGIGGIGSLVARKVYHGFGMKVIALNRGKKAIEEIELVSKWEDIFKRADFISLHLPANENTRGIIGKKEFELMKTSAYLINTARGTVVNEKELIYALKNKKIKGAGLDVFEKEPPNICNELFSLNNVLASPHNAALTHESIVRMAVDSAQGICEVLSGKQPTWPVNNI